jgi:hypothetical protein
MTALPAVRLRQQLENGHRRRALVSFVIGCDFSSTFQRPVDECDQALKFFDGRVAVFHIAGGNLRRESDVLPAFFQESL